MATLSYLHTPRTTPFIYQSVPAFFNDKIKSQTGEAFVYYKTSGTRESISYEELKVNAERFANHLIKNGIKRGERVAICGKNSMNWIVAEMGILMSGGVSLHTSITKKDASDVSEILDLAKCNVILFDTGDNGEHRNALSDLTQSRKKNNSSDSRAFTVILLRPDEFIEKYPDVSSITDIQLDDIELPLIDSEDPAVIFTTSGSLGKPKLVEHTHFNIVNFDKTVFFKTSNGGLTTTFNDRPFSWILGSPLNDIIAGQKRVFCDILTSIDGSSTEKLWNIIKEEECDTAVMLPYVLEDLLTLKENFSDGFKLKYISTGGQVVQRKYLNILGVFTDVLLIGYGSSEAVAISVLEIRTFNTVVPLGSVGKPVPDVEAKIVDEFGDVSQRGIIGEIYLRNPCQFTGYVNNDEANRTAFAKGGWFKTGDTGCITNDGELIIKGRTKDIISRGSRKIIPQSIEEYIQKMEGLREVSVIAVPDKRLYEEVCVCFVSNSNSNVGPDDIQHYCKTHFLSKDSIDGIGDMPKYFLKFQEFPKLANGKPDKNQIKTIAITRLSDI